MKTSLLLVLASLTLAGRAETTPLAQATAAVARNDLAAAEALLAPLVATEKPDAAACHQLGLIRQRQGKPADAVPLLEHATQLDATKPEYFSALGAAIGQQMSTATFMQQAMLSGKLRKAFAKSVELDPNHVAGLIGLARFYAGAPEIAGGSIAQARAFAVRVQKLHPLLGELELGTVAEREDDYAAALSHFEAAAKLKADHAGAQFAAGRMLAKLGRKPEARARFETTLQLDPKRDAATRKAIAELESAAP